MEQGTVTFTAQITSGDFFRANLSYIWRKTRILAWVLLAFLSLVIWAAVYENDTDVQWHNLIVNVAPLLVLFALYPLLIYFSSRSTYKTTRGLQGPVQFAFSEAGMETSSLGSDWRSEWANVYKVVESKSFFFAFGSNRVAWPIPKRCIPDRESLSRLRELFRTHVAGKVKLLKN